MCALSLQQFMLAFLNHHDLSLTITIVYLPVEHKPASDCPQQGREGGLNEADEAWWLQDDNELETTYKTHLIYLSARVTSCSRGSFVVSQCELEGDRFLIPDRQIS